MVKASDLGARGRGFNSHLWYSNIVLQNIEKQLFGNHISVHYMLIGSTQVLQGHCPLVLKSPLGILLLGGCPPFVELYS